MKDSLRAFFCFIDSSVSHRVKDDVDSQWIRLLFRELLEIVLALAFALPAIAQVGIVAERVLFQGVLGKEGVSIGNQHRLLRDDSLMNR